MIYELFICVLLACKATADWSPRLSEGVLRQMRSCLSNSTTKLEEKVEAAPRKRPLQVVDASLLFNEIELLEIRLYELRDVVDYFLVVEQNETHTGKRKELVYQKHYGRLMRRLGPHVMKKVIYKNCAYPAEMRVDKVVIGRSPQQALHWRRENYPREVCTRDLLLNLKKALFPDALLLQSDMDEIPDALAVASFKYCQYTMQNGQQPRLVAFRQARYHFNFHCASSNMYHWTGTMLTSVENALELGLQKLRDLRQTTADCRVAIGWGGWHFSNSPFGNASKLVDKYTAFTESQTIDHVKPEDLLAYWTHAMANGGDVRSNTHCEEHELRHLPRLVQDMPLAYKHLLTAAQLDRLID